MNTHVDLTLSLAADGSALPSLFFRPADRLRLEGCVAALTQEGRSLALSSEHDAALDHYGHLLAQRLRRASPKSQIETYFPNSTDALVARFNEVLAGHTMREAMSEPAQHSGERIWLVHDAGSLAEHELQLLARLVSNFPGANIRVVLLLGPSLRSRKAFESLGRRFVRWDIEAPTPEQAHSMLEQARVDGCETLVSQLLRRLQPSVVSSRQADFSSSTAPFGFASAPQADRSLPEPAQAAHNRLSAHLQAWVQALPPKLAHLRSRLSAARRPSGVDRSEGGGPRGRSSPSPSSAEPKSRRPRLPKARWILAVGGLAALSVAVSAWLHGGRFGVSKPATQQPVKDVRSGAQAPALNRAAGPHTQAAQAAESQT
jgi:hypothetical protein